MNLPEHIEKYIGRIEYGWSSEDKPSDVQVVKISNSPVPGVTTYATLGMSWTELSMTGGRVVRQELLFGAYDRYDSRKIASFLLTFCKHVLGQGRALLRGSVMGPYGPVISGTNLESVYSTLPMFFHSALATFEATEPPTAFVWLVPIVAAEARFVELNGWSSFEDILENTQPDFWNLDRISLVE